MLHHVYIVNNLHKTLTDFSTHIRAYVLVISNFSNLEGKTKAQILCWPELRRFDIEENILFSLSFYFLFCIPKLYVFVKSITGC
jgi:hypothetical protein